MGILGWYMRKTKSLRSSPHYQTKDLPHYPPLLFAVLALQYNYALGGIRKFTISGFVHYQIHPFERTIAYRLLKRGISLDSHTKQLAQLIVHNLFCTAHTKDFDMLALLRWMVFFRQDLKLSLSLPHINSKPPQLDPKLSKLLRYQVQHLKAEKWEPVLMREEILFPKKPLTLTVPTLLAFLMQANRGVYDEQEVNKNTCLCVISYYLAWVKTDKNSTTPVKQIIEQKIDTKRYNDLLKELPQGFLPKPHKSKVLSETKEEEKEEKTLILSSHTTLLHIAAAMSFSYPQYAKFLLARGASIDAKDSWGRTVTEIACRFGKMDLFVQHQLARLAEKKNQ